MATASTLGKSIEDQIAQLNGDVLYEIVNGEVKEIPHMGNLASSVATFLLGYIFQFNLSRRLGFPALEALFKMRADLLQRRPDLAFIRWERWVEPPTLTEDPPAWEVVPNLAVEVVSPTNTATEIEDKVLEYFEAGVGLVWVVYPLKKRVYVYESPTKVSILNLDDELDGGNVLPGFCVKIEDLFTPLVKP